MLDGKRIGGARAAEGLVPILVRSINREAVHASDSLVIHAGGVEHDGVGLAFPAVMESGKTTLTAGLVRSGFNYLTDEAVAIDRTTQIIQPYPKPLSIDSGAWHLFPEFEPHANLGSDAYKADQWQVPPEAIRPDAVGRPCPLRVIVFPRYERGTETVVEPLHRAPALMELARHTFKFNDDGARSLDILADIARSAQCYRLTMGDLAPAVAVVSRLVGNVSKTGVS